MQTGPLGSCCPCKHGPHDTSVHGSFPFLLQPPQPPVPYFSHHVGSAPRVSSYQETLLVLTMGTEATVPGGTKLTVLHDPGGGRDV